MKLLMLRVQTRIGSEDFECLALSARLTRGNCLPARDKGR